MHIQSTAVRLLCVAVVAAVMLPVGEMMFPYIGHAISSLTFQALEAMVSATLGFGLYAAIFG